MEMEGVKSVNITYNLGKMLPACWTSSYRSIMEQPRRVSSLKNISNFLNSSNARISNKSSITKKKHKPTNQQSHRKINCALIKENGSEREREKLTEFIVFVRGKLRSPKLGEHLSRVFQGISKIVRVLNNKKKMSESEKLGL